MTSVIEQIKEATVATLYEHSLKCNKLYINSQTLSQSVCPSVGSGWNLSHHKSALVVLFILQRSIDLVVAVNPDAVFADEVMWPPQQ